MPTLDELLITDPPQAKTMDDLLAEPVPQKRTLDQLLQEAPVESGFSSDTAFQPVTDDIAAPSDLPNVEIEAQPPTISTAVRAGEAAFTTTPLLKDAGTGKPQEAEPVAEFQVPDAIDLTGETPSRPGLAERTASVFANKVALETLEKSRPSSNVVESISVLMQVQKDLGDLPEDPTFWQGLKAVPRIWWSMVKEYYGSSSKQERAESQEALKTLRPSLVIDVPEAENVPEKIADIGAGIGAFITKLLIARKVIPPGTVLTDVVAWELVNQADGGLPGQGAVLAGSLGAVGVIKSVAVRTAAQSSLFAGLTAAEGGSKEDVIIAAAIPAVLAGINTKFPRGKPTPGKRQTGVQKAEVARKAARAEVDAALKIYKKTGDRTAWDAVRTKYTGAPGSAAAPTETPTSQRGLQIPAVAGQPPAIGTLTPSAGVLSPPPAKPVQPLAKTTPESLQQAEAGEQRARAATVPTKAQAVTEAEKAQPTVEAKPTPKKQEAVGKVVEKSIKIETSQDIEGKVFSHGTFADFGTFEQQGNRGSESVDMGFHFGSDQTADIVIKNRQEVEEKGQVGLTFAKGIDVSNPRIIQAELDIKNPLRLEEERGGNWSPGDVIRKIAQKLEAEETIEGLSEEDIDGIFNDEVIHDGENFFDLDDVKQEADLLQKWLGERGYDGIVYENKFEGGGDSLIAFRPEQIKQLSQPTPQAKPALSVTDLAAKKSELITKRRGIKAISPKKRTPQQIKDLNDIEDEIVQRFADEFPDVDITEKTRRREIKKVKDQIISHGIYQVEVETSQNVPDLGGSFAVEQSEMSDIKQRFEGQPKILKKFRVAKKGLRWDQAASEIGIDTLDDFLDMVEIYVNTSTGAKGIDDNALARALSSGDILLEISALKHDMLRDGFTAAEVNKEIEALAADQNIDRELLETEFISLEELSDVSKKQRILREVEKEVGAVKAKKAAAGQPKEIALNKARQVALRTGRLRFVSLSDGKYRITRNPPKKGDYFAVTPPATGQLSGSIKEVKGEPLPTRRVGRPNVLLVTTAEKELEKKAMISESLKLKPGARRLAKMATGETDLRKMTDDDLAKFTRWVKRLPEPTYNNKGVRVPPSIPRTTALATKGFFESRFKRPTILREVTSQEFYAEKIGVKGLVEKAERGKLEMNLEFQKISNKVDRMGARIDKLGKTTLKQKAAAKLKNLPTAAIERFANLLDTNENPPADLTPQEKELFDFFRGLTREMLVRENQVREALDLEPIKHRKAYMRHIAKGISRDVLAGRYPFPEGRLFQAAQLIAKKIFNPMEMQRKVQNDIEELFTKDLVYATKAMLWTALKEIHLSQPIRFLEQQLTARGKDLPGYKNLTQVERDQLDKIMVIPKRTREWVRDYVNVVIKGQQSWLDADIEAVFTHTGLKGVLDRVLAPFGRTLGYRPWANFVGKAGHAQILGVLGGIPGIGRPRQIIRNKFQVLQNMAFYPLYKETLRKYAPLAMFRGNIPPQLEKLLDESLFLRAYTGTEDWPVGAAGKVSKAMLSGFQWSAVSNARQSMEIAYWGMLPLFSEAKFKKYGWSDPNRTFKEDKHFLYPSEKKMMLKEMEFGTAATQHNYTAMGMPQIFRHKGLTPLTRLQSWWMNHYFRFLQEAAGRAFTGKPTWSGEEGPTLPWKYRLGLLRYLLIAVPLLNTMGYERSFLFGAAPTGVPPFAQFLFGMYDYAIGVGARDERLRKKGLTAMGNSGMTFIPGYLTYKDWEAIWSGRKDLKSLLFYQKQRKRRKQNQ